MRINTLEDNTSVEQEEVRAVRLWDGYQGL